MALVVAVLGSAGLLLIGPSGTDLAAQRARAAFAAAHPGAAVDFRWYGGVFPAAYSVLAPYVEAVVGVRATGLLAAVAGSVLLAVLLVRWRARFPGWAAGWGASAQVADVASGRVTFALGLTLGLGALVSVPPPGRRGSRWVAAIVLAGLTGLASPVAALFLGLVALGWALRRRRIAWLAVATAAPVGAIGLLFAEPGRMPDTWAVARPVLLACLAVVVLCRGMALRATALVYGIGAAVVYAWPGPLGSNVERLALLFTGAVLLAASWLPRVLLAVAMLVAGQWTARVPLTDLTHASRLNVERAASLRLVQILAGLGPVTGRVEVAPFADHGEADIVAAHRPLARGWERQLDLVRARPLYSHRLDDAAYLDWLRRNEVQFVALGRHAHDWSAGNELRVLRHAPPWLVVVHADPEWTVWRVVAAPSIVSGDAADVSVLADRIAFTAPHSGDYRLGVRWSQWLTVSSGACIQRAGPAVNVRVRRAGTVTVSSSYLAPLTGRHC